MMSLAGEIMGRETNEEVAPTVCAGVPWAHGQSNLLTEVVTQKKGGPCKARSALRIEYTYKGRTPGLADKYHKDSIGKV